MSLLGASIAAGAHLACQPARSPRSGPPGPKALPAGSGSPHWIADLDSASSCCPADSPPSPGAAERQHSLRPFVGSPGEAQSTEGRGGASGSLSTSLLHPSTRGASARLAHPAASRSPGPGSGVFAVAAYTRARPPRPPYRIRTAVRPDTAMEQPAESFLRGKRRDGAGRRGGRKSAWRKGRGGGPCSPTGSRWGGRSQGPPPPVLTST